MNPQRTVLAALIAGCLLACAQLAAATAEPQQAADPRVADLARAGKVRIGLFLPQYIKDPATGQLRSVWVETARAFAGHLGVQLVVVEHATPPEAIACLKAGRMRRDVSAARRTRSRRRRFLEPDFSVRLHLAGAGRLVDRPHRRRRPARCSHRGRTQSRLHHRAQQPVEEAELVYAETPDSTFDLLRTGQAHVMASTRLALGLFGPAARIARAGGALRCEHQQDGGSEIVENAKFGPCAEGDRTRRQRGVTRPRRQRQLNARPDPPGRTFGTAIFDADIC